MADSFKAILASFDDREKLAKSWSEHMPRDMKVDVADINLWVHRNSVPAWAWGGLLFAAHVAGKPDITFEKLWKIEMRARRQRLGGRKVA